MIKKYYLFIAFLLLGLMACDDPFEGKTYMEDTISEEPLLSNGEWLTANADQFSLWTEVLKRADMFNAISDASSTFTMFIPNNEAVKRFFDLKGVKSANELEISYAKDLVKYHIISGEISRSMFLSGGRLTNATLFGPYLNVSFVNSNDAVGTGIWLNEEAEVVTLAEGTTNGIIYTLNNVLLPVTETVYDKITLNSDYSIFKEALDLTGWGNRLNRVTDTVYSDLGSKGILNLKFTCFVVSNSAYQNSYITSINDLVAKLEAGQNYSDTTNALYQYVAYHIMNKSYYQEALYPFQENASDSTILWSTQATNGMFSTNWVEGNASINYTTISAVNITEANITARNGVMHIVDNYMPIFVPEAQKVIWDFCDYSDVESVVNTICKNKGLGDCYGIQQTTDLKVPLYSSTSMTSYDYISYNSSSRGTWDVVGYYISKDEYTPMPNNYDLLCLNLGYMGWVTMKTPTIIKGKYQVKLHYLHLDTYMKDFIEGGSLASITLDNDENTSKQISFYKGIKSGYQGTGLHEIELYSEIEFEETTSHTFKLNIQDPRASSHKTYALLLDYVEFIPKK